MTTPSAGPLDTAVIMAAHQPRTSAEYEFFCRKCFTPVAAEGCEPYRLAEALRDRERDQPRQETLDRLAAGKAQRQSYEGAADQPQ